MKTIIKEENRNSIKDFAAHGAGGNMQGSKLKALYSLIQKKGEAIETENIQDGHKWVGVKALEFAKGEYIALKHLPVKKGCFFPCALRQLHMVAL